MDWLSSALAGPKSAAGAGSRPARVNAWNQFAKGQISAPITNVPAHKVDDSVKAWRHFADVHRGEPSAPVSNFPSDKVDDDVKAWRHFADVHKGQTSAPVNSVASRIVDDSVKAWRYFADLHSGRATTNLPEDNGAGSNLKNELIAAQERAFIGMLVTTTKTPLVMAPEPPKVKLPPCNNAKATPPTSCAATDASASDASDSKAATPNDTPNTQLTPESSPAGKKSSKWQPLPVEIPAGKSATPGDVSTGTPWAKVAAAPPRGVKTLPMQVSQAKVASPQTPNRAINGPTASVTPSSIEKPKNDLPLEHFPVLGTTPSPNAERPKQNWTPAPGNSDHEVAVKSVFDIVKDQERERMWETKRAEERRQEAVEEQRKALALVAARERAFGVRTKVEQSGTSQIRLPKELWMHILLELTARDRCNFAQTCKDANAVLSIVTSVWTFTAGEFGGCDQGRKRPVGNTAAPITRHAITVIRVDPDHDRRWHRGHEMNMIQKMTIALSNMSAHIRRLEFWATPLLTTRLLQLLVPAMRNLEYLGVFRCPLIHLAHTELLLSAISDDDRKSPVQLDFFPSTNTIQYLQRDVELPIAVPALLYRILPKARAQDARLIEPGSAFRAFLKEIRCNSPSEFLQSMERQQVSTAILEAMTYRNSGGKVKVVDPKSNYARLFHCHKKVLPGCFFPKAQLKDPECATCWGCRLENELLRMDRDPNGTIHEHWALDEWLNDVDLERALMKARAARPVPPKQDKSWYQVRLDYENEKRLQQLIAAGKVEKGATRIPARLDRFAKVRRTAY